MYDFSKQEIVRVVKYNIVSDHYDNYDSVISNVPAEEIKERFQKLVNELKEQNGYAEVEIQVFRANAVEIPEDADKEEFCDKHWEYLNSVNSGNLHDDTACFEDRETGKRYSMLFGDSLFADEYELELKWQNTDE